MEISNLDELAARSRKRSYNQVKRVPGRLPIRTSVRLHAFDDVYRASEMLDLTPGEFMRNAIEEKTRRTIDARRTG